MESETYDNLKKAEKGAWLSIIVYIILASVKLFVGYTGNSNALMADGLNNLTDIIASSAVLIGLKIARIPPDHNHQYGHLRAESISSIIAAFIMITVGIQILIQAVKALFANEYVTPDMLTAWTALASAIIMYLVYYYNRQLSKKVNSQSLMAAAHDNRSDAFVSIGAFIGILGASFGLPWLDSITAIVVGLIVCYTGITIFKDSTYTLTDGFDTDQLAAMTQTVRTVSDVLDVKDIKARTHGNRIFLEVTVLVDPQLNVIEGHKITEEIEEHIHSRFPDCFTLVHIEPFQHWSPAHNGDLVATLYADENIF